MAVLQGGGKNLPSPCVCYPKDPMWNRVNISIIHVCDLKHFAISERTLLHLLTKIPEC